MIAIRFKPCFEDRANIFFKQSELKDKGIEINYEEVPDVVGGEQRLAYWILKPKRNFEINLILKELRELKQIMGVHDLQFQYVYSMKEYFVQHNDLYGSLPWFDI